MVANSLIGQISAGSDARIATAREAFRQADRPMRHKMSDDLPPAEIDFLGMRMHVDPTDNYTDRCLWLDGVPPEIKSLTALIELIEGRRAFILDVGANTGVFTVPFAMATASGSRISSFEPHPVTRSRLNHNLRLNNLEARVDVFDCALGDVSGNAVLYQNNWNLGQCSLVPKRKGRVRATQQVKVRSILDFIEDDPSGFEISMIKLDVEGSEDRVLRPLINADGWLPEVILMETAHAALWQTEIADLLLQRGFNARRFETEGNTLFVRS